jgi:hypothetical protein
VSVRARVERLEKALLDHRWRKRATARLVIYTPGQPPPERPAGPPDEGPLVYMPDNGRGDVRR